MFCFFFGLFTITGQATKCFSSNEELSDAVEELQLSDGPINTYGPIADWCFEDTVNSTRLLFAGLASFNVEYVCCLIR